MCKDVTLSLWFTTYTEIISDGTGIFMLKHCSVSLPQMFFFIVEVLASNNMIWEYNNMIWEIEEDCSCAENKHNCCSGQCINAEF